MVNKQAQTTYSSVWSCNFYLINSEAIAVPFQYQCLCQEAIWKHVFLLHAQKEIYLFKFIIFFAASEGKKKVGICL